MSIPVLHASGTYSQAKRKLGADHPTVIAAHRELVTARLLVTIERIMADGPALTAGQVDRVTAFLAASGQP